MSTANAFKVVFAIGSDERFAALVAAYERIRACKAAEVWPEKKEE